MMGTIAHVQKKFHPMKHYHIDLAKYIGDHWVNLVLK